MDVCLQALQFRLTATAEVAAAYVCLDGDGHSLAFRRSFLQGRTWVSPGRGLKKLSRSLHQTCALCSLDDACASWEFLKLGVPFWEGKNNTDYSS